MISRLADGYLYDSSTVKSPWLHEVLELARYRFLLENLIARDLRVRYKRSVLGFFWSMINPLLTMVVLVIVFTGILGRFNVEHYPINLLAGLLLWRLFSGGTSQAMHSVVGNAGIRQKIHVPSSVFVAGSIGSALVNLMLAMIPLLVLALLTGVRAQITWLYLPVPIVMTTLFSFGVGLIVAAIAVFFADMFSIYDVLLNACFYLTPILYPISILPAPLIKLEQLNPMHHYIDAFRLALLEGRLPDPGSVLVSSLMALGVGVVGLYVFTRLSDRFAYST